MSKTKLSSLSKTSNTGWKGIYLRPTTNKYEAQVSIKVKEGKHTKVHVGIYDTFGEAKQAREQFILSLM